MLPLAVIIPAYHGSRVLERSLASLAEQDFGAGVLRPSDVHIVVAVNDGRNDTFAAAEARLPALRARGMSASVIITPTGRIQALRMGESQAPRVSHRVYLDQDARLSPGALAALASGLGRPGIEFATLAPAFERAETLAVRRFCQAWVGLPYVRSSPATMGLYAVSAQGRARWNDWPDLAADDKAVRLLFAPAMRLLITNESYNVLPPKSWGELVRARARYMLSNRELEKRSLQDAIPRYRGVISLVLKPRLWPDVAVVLAAQIAAKVQVYRSRLWTALGK